MSTRKRFGAVLIVASIIGWLLLGRFGIGKDRVVDSHWRFGGSGDWGFQITKPGRHLPLWCRVLLLGGIGAGIVLLVLPDDDKGG